MKKYLFIVIQDPVGSKLLIKLLKLCRNYFTNIYLKESPFVNYNKYDNVKIKNRNSDPPGTYIIQYINNNIKCYSLKLTLTNGTVQDKVTPMEIDDDLNSTLPINDNNIYQSPMNEEQDNIFNVHVDYKVVKLAKNFNFENLKIDIESKLNSYFKYKPKKSPKSVVVIDLDDTLINKDFEIIIEPLDQYLNVLRQHFDYVVLWSHGCQQHVNHAFSTVMKPYFIYFNDIIAKSASSKIFNKGIGRLLYHLNKKFDVLELNNTLLIDDQLCNYNYDYDFFIHAPHNSDIHSTRMWELLNTTIKKIMKRNIVL